MTEQDTSETVAGPAAAVGPVIRAARLRAGIGLRRCAAEVGIQHGYLSELERGVKTAPSPDVLRRVAVRLDIPPADLGVLEGPDGAGVDDAPGTGGPAVGAA